jgi:hypothetical protein
MRLNRVIDIKCIPTRINDIPGRIGPQIKEIATQKSIAILVGFPNIIMGCALYFLLG